MKKVAQLFARALQSTGVLRALEQLDHSSRLRVLVYHRVDELWAEPDLDPGLISATPAEFRAQMQIVAEHYDVVSLPTVLAAQRGETSLPARAVLITFDDGYRDFAEHAWPVLRELGLPAVLFVSTAFPDQSDQSGFWWDRLHAGLRLAEDGIVNLPNLGAFDLAEPKGRRVALKACKQYVKSLPHDQAMDWVDTALRELGEVPPLARVLDWDTLAELSREGLALCAHGHSHALCTQLSADELKADLSTSKARLAQELGDDSCASVLAWPANACNQQVCDIARELGFEMAFGGGRGLARLPIEDAMNVTRIPAHRYESALFRALLRPSIAGFGRWVINGPRRAIG